ncbi:hypothetical protein CERSUDRAFT_90257 [Gelatoporia subvermispora B]|uniref:Peptidase S1 domain-containing protein n=1 Tax=Ceriporiopsis subvermispora (strain B) TaxID=914234 RepID=M2RB64_CERS8|nr:hypothetical protein CERSUDRAFT_90257 [Gelatoporia subvermispora B]
MVSQLRSLCSTKWATRPFHSPSSLVRTYAVVGTATFVGQPPTPPIPPAESSTPALAPFPSAFDAEVLLQLRKRAFTSPGAPTYSHRDVPLPNLVEQYLDRNGRVLNIQLPYEPHPEPGTCIAFGTAQEEHEDGLAVMIVHSAIRGPTDKVTHCSGFALNVPGGQSVVVTCAHTFDEIRHHPILHSEGLDTTPQSTGEQSHPLISGSFLISGPPSSPTFTPVASVLAAMNRADIMLLSPSSTSQLPGVRKLPLSPYPAHPGTRIRARFVSDTPPANDPELWRPWIGGTFTKWARGTIVGYRDFAGREAKPGTYDALAHLLFEPLPTPGSSGGPIVDEDTGAVIGVILGTQMRNRLEGVCGWGVPSETIYEMFSLPGLKLNN